MRLALALLAFVALLAGCAETVRCPDGQIFGHDGACVPIPDAGPQAARDAGDGG